MKKLFLSIAVFVMALCANAQTNQYFWYQGNLMMGNPIAQIDSVTFGNEDMDSIMIFLPRTIIKTVEVHDTVYITIHDTVCPNAIPEGGLAGEFSVSATKKVRFSQGNLQYNAAEGSHQCADGTTQQGTWRFTENQWDYVGDDAGGNVYLGETRCHNWYRSSTYNGWIDNFGFGTSGWNSGAVSYQPFVTTRCEDYEPGGDWHNSLSGDYVNADWGVYNAIINGGNLPNQWRSLTHEEVEYLLNNRTNSTNLRGQAVVNNVNGYVFLPDDWITPSDLTWEGNTNNWTTNQYTKEQWQKMESSGAIFLPAGGHGNQNGSAGSCGRYWTASIEGECGAWCLGFGENYANIDSWVQRQYWFSVRLVQDVEE